MTQVGYQIVHSIAGRMRIQVSWFETDPQAASSYQSLVEALTGVKSVRLNPIAQSIVVEYSPRKMNTAQAQELFISVMQQVKLTPPATAPTVDQKPDPKTNPSKHIAVDENIAPKTEASDPPTVATEPIEQPKNEPQKPKPVAKQSVAPEIPSPWDEESSQQNETELSNELSIEEKPIEEKSIEEITQSSIEPSAHTCSTAALAKRLKVTSQAITRRRAKADFGQWTQAQDPESIAWNYHSDDRLFHAISSDTKQ